MIDGSLRKVFEPLIAPVGKKLQRLGITPDILTAVGLLFACISSIVIANGFMVAGAACMLAAGLPDMLDGAVAKVSGRASKRGAFFDSVSDRATDALLLGGVGWYLAGRDGARAAILAYAALAFSFLISYQRAKAESLGYDARGGIMERAERTILLGAGVLFAEKMLVPSLWILIILSALTSIQRFVKVWRQAEAPVPLPSRRLRTSRTFREWRELSAKQRSERYSARRARRQTFLEKRRLTSGSEQGIVSRWRAVADAKLRLRDNDPANSWARSHGRVRPSADWRTQWLDKSRDHKK